MWKLAGVASSGITRAIRTRVRNRLALIAGDPYRILARAVMDAPSKVRMGGFGYTRVALT